MENLLNVDPDSKWIIDTDPGIDDSFALILAMTHIKDNLVAISIEAGNTGLSNCFTNACKISAICNKYYPVYKGITQCVSSNKGKNAEGIHGKDGLYEIADFVSYHDKYSSLMTESGSLLDSTISPMKIIELSHKYNPINLLCLGPLTNIALAYMLDNTLPSRINKFVIMGGSYTTRGNLQPCVEFNFYFDPLSAKVILSNFNNLIIYPWETDEIHKLKLTDIESTEDQNDRMKFCRICIQNKIKVLERNSKQAHFGADFPDYGAAIAAFIPNSVKKFSVLNADVVVDSSPEVNGTMLTSYAMNLPGRKKIILIEELHQEVFVESFKRMIK